MIPCGSVAQPPVHCMRCHADPNTPPPLPPHTPPLDLCPHRTYNKPQVVRTDLHELYNLPLQGKPLAYTPFCNSNEETAGYRFWEQGYWKSTLGVPARLPLPRRVHVTCSARLATHGARQTCTVEENPPPLPHEKLMC